MTRTSQREKRTWQIRLLQTATRIGILWAISLAGLTTQAGVHFQTLKAFAPAETQAFVTAIPGSDGQIYGTTMLGGSNRWGEVFGVRPDGSGYQVLHSFGTTATDGLYPFAQLLEGKDGLLYGTTTSGGASGNQAGTVFKVGKDGSGYAVLHSFGDDGDGNYPRYGGGWGGPMPALIQGSDGSLYGTTPIGGAYANEAGFGGGTVFKLNHDGSGYRVLHSLGAKADGQNPNARLLEGTDGALYGTTIYGGAQQSGTVFRLNNDGSRYAVIYDFPPPNGGEIGELVEGAGGALFGIKEWGGKYSAEGFNQGFGQLFKVNKDGTGYTVLHDFGAAGDGRFPGNGWAKGSDDAFYGSAGGGANGSGCVFRLAGDGSNYSLVYSFRPGDAVWGLVGLTQGTDGALYGTSGSDLILRLETNGSGYRVVYQSVVSRNTEANEPNALVEGSEGAFYGTAARPGGDVGGVVFKINRNGSGYNVLHSFGRSEGNSPAGLIQGRDGALYGAVLDGGTNAWGSVFKITKSGSGYTVLHQFGITDENDGQSPSTLLQGSDGALYGTTLNGGAYEDQSGSGFGATFKGTIFKLNTDGNGYSLLHSFGGLHDGQWLRSALIEGSDHLLYGTTMIGGPKDSSAGTVFTMNRNGSGYRIICDFAGTGAWWPDASLMEGSDQALYGATYGGAIFKLNKDGSGFTTLATLGYSGELGSFHSPLVEGLDGALYGTAFKEAGYIFRLTKDGGNYSVLHTFGRGIDGIFPNSGLALSSDGLFYGTTSDYGFPGGTVYRLWPPQTPDLNAVTKTQKGTELSLAGPSGYRYQLSRSTNLTNWSAF